MKNYYDVLGVSPNASKAVLDAVYKSLMSNAKELSDEKISEIEEAYRVLSSVDEGKSAGGGHGSGVKWIFCIIIICIAAWGVKTFWAGRNVTNDNIWGTFESKDGDLLAVELIENWDSVDEDVYTAWITHTDTPWLKEFALIDMADGKMEFSNEEDSYTFELKKNKLKIEDKEYKKISDKIDYDKILDKESMTQDTIIGAYKNRDSINIIIEPGKTKETVTVSVYTGIGVKLGSLEEISYIDFFNNGEVPIQIDKNECVLCFQGKDVIKCDGFLDLFFKVEDFDVNDAADITESDAPESNAPESDAPESDVQKPKTNTENTVSISDEDKIWFVTYNQFQSEGKSLTVDPVTDAFMNVYCSGSDGSSVIWDFGMEPDEIGSDGAMIYNSKDISMSYYPTDHHIKIKASNDAYAGDYQYMFDFNGEWSDSVSQRCYMEITCQNDIYYDITIDWAVSASDNAHWEFLAEYDAAQGCLVYHNGRHTQQYYPDDGSGVQETEIYVNGEGSIYQKDGKVYWDDKIENAGSSCIFER